MIFSLIIYLTNVFVKILYPLHYGVMAVKDEKEEKLVALLKYFFLFPFVYFFEFLLSKISSADFITWFTTAIYSFLIHSDFDYSILLFNLIFLKQKEGYEKFGSRVEALQNRINNLLSSNIGEYLNKIIEFARKNAGGLLNLVISA